MHIGARCPNLTVVVCVSPNLTAVFVGRLGTSPKVLRKGEPTTENPSMVLIHRLKTAKGKSVTLARVHRGDLMATGGAGDVLEEALLPKENGRPGGMGWVALSAAPSITYRRGTGSQLPSSSADSSAEQETSVSLVWRGPDVCPL
jgi:hypothetical protein